MKTDQTLPPHATTSTPTLETISTFLTKYSARLLGSGATCIRIEKNITRIARAFGSEVELVIMPRHLHISVWRRNHRETITKIATVTRPAISFAVNTELSELSWELADGKIDLDSAFGRLHRITHRAKEAEWPVVILVTLANASFCRLFGGDFTAMGVVAVATFVGYLLKLFLLGRKLDTRFVFFSCAFVSALIGCLAVKYGLGTTPDIALGTSVLYLVPGIPFLNSFSDMLYRYYLCALSRFADAVVLTCSLSAGLLLAMTVMHVGIF